MSVFFNKISTLEKVSIEQQPTDSKKRLYFMFDDLFAIGEQLHNSNVTISRMIFPFSYEKPKNLTRNQINHLINTFNQRIPLVKNTFKKMSSNELQVNLIIDYSLDDEMFKQVDLYRDIDLLISTSVMFQNMLLGKTDFLDE
jgi:hypothetical protein